MVSAAAIRSSTDRRRMRSISAALDASKHRLRLGLELASRMDGKEFMNRQPVNHALNPPAAQGNEILTAERRLIIFLSPRSWRHFISIA